MLQQTCSRNVSATIQFCPLESLELIKMVKSLDMVCTPPGQKVISWKFVTIVVHNSINVHALLQSAINLISLTTDAWSSQFYRGYVAVAAHSIDERWNLKSVLLEFQRFPTPRTASKTSSLLQ